jgi:hypothetical protein
VLKWVGLVASLLLVAACILLSGGRGFGFTLAGRATAVEVAIYRVAAHITVAHLSEARTPVVEATALYWVDSGDRDYQWSGIRAYATHGVSCSPARLSLYWVLLVVTGLTAILWYRDRRRPAGRCPRCGYDLTGNVSGRCPECGEPAPQSS